MACADRAVAVARWSTQAQPSHVHPACTAQPPATSAPVRRRKHSCCALLPSNRESAGCQHGTMSARPSSSHAHAPCLDDSPGWWGHVGGALTVAALTTSILMGAPQVSHASMWQARTPTATYAPAPPESAPQPWLLPPAGETLSNNHAQLQLGNPSDGFSAVQALQLHGAQDGGALDSPQGSGIQVLVPGLASEAEDKLLEAVRQIEARMDSAMGAVVRSGPRLPFGNVLGDTAASDEEVKRVNEVAHMLVSEVWEVVDQNYLDARGTGWDRDNWRDLRDAALARTYTDTSSAYRAIREMMAWGLSDPYCRFITPTELAAMKKYDVTGIGLNLGTSSEYALKTGRQLPRSRAADNTGVFVVGLSKGSPADMVGIRQGDELVEVDGISLATQSPFQAASLIAGQQADTDGVAPTQRPFVELKVRKNDGMSSVVTVERPVRALNSPVTSSLAKGQTESVGLLRLSSFNARAQRDLKTAIYKLQKQGAKSLVLDLRDNRGGLVSEGLEVARLFLDDDAPIVYTESRSIPGDAPRALGPALTRLPLLVLVNEHTASASEIVAGALHDNCRAVLVGSRTYGKGLIQSVYELSDGSGMVLTVGKYLTPNRTDIDRSGIQPDFSSRPSARLAAETLDACRLERTEKQAAPQPRM